MFKKRLQLDPRAAAALTRLRKGIVNRDCIPLLAERVECNGASGGRSRAESLADLQSDWPAERWIKRTAVMWTIQQWIPAGLALLAWIANPRLRVTEAILRGIVELDDATFEVASRNTGSWLLCYVCLSLVFPLAVNWLCRVESEDSVIRRIIRTGGFLIFFEDPARFERTPWVWRVRFFRFWLFLPVAFAWFAAYICFILCGGLETPWFHIGLWTWIGTLAAAGLHNWELEVETTSFMGLDELSRRKQQSFGDAHLASDNELRKADLI